MRRSLWAARMLVLLLVAAGQSLMAVAPRMPNVVGPRPFFAREGCPLLIETPNGGGPGTPIPFKALRLGALVARATDSFVSGGGTAFYRDIARRQAAGLPYQPKIYDPTGSAKPMIFADDFSSAERIESGSVPSLIYQELLIKRPERGDLDRGYVFAVPVSQQTARVAALTLTLPTRAKAPPRYRITRGIPRSEGCSTETLDVYATRMSAAAVGRLFQRSGCNWLSLSACKGSTDRPRGWVLFVHRYPDQSLYEHRWINYDVIASLAGQSSD